MKTQKCEYCEKYYQAGKNAVVGVCNNCDDVLKDNQEDKLKAIFDKQMSLQTRLGYTQSELLQNQEFININILAMLDELSEALRETQWKNPKVIKYGWKKTQEFNAPKFKDELIDMLHFFVNLCISAGLTHEMLYIRYMSKNRENFKRQDRGY